MASLRTLVSALLLGAGAAAGPAVVTGATGRTGALAYNLLKSKGVPVRALVRNVTKAKELLGCVKCDASEGIFVGDVTEPATLVAPMQGAGFLVIATSAAPVCNPYPTCSYPKGAAPIDIDWQGGRAQVQAFATATKGQGQVVLISSAGTTDPANPLDSDALGHINFYKLNLEASLMASNVPYTIIKPCGLIDAPTTPKDLIIGHDDDIPLTTGQTVTRDDVARVVVAAVMEPQVSARLRFDLCATAGTPTPDAGLEALLKAARLPWEHSASQIAV